LFDDQVIDREQDGGGETQVVESHIKTVHPNRKGAA